MEEPPPNATIGASDNCLNGRACSALEFRSRRSDRLLSSSSCLLSRRIIPTAHVTMSCRAISRTAAAKVHAFQALQQMWFAASLPS